MLTISTAARVTVKAPTPIRVRSVESMDLLGIKDGIPGGDHQNARKYLWIWLWTRRKR
jgi:hypothetical protein